MILLDNRNLHESVPALLYPWQLTTRADWRVSRLADRHYSRQKPGSRQFSPPGMNLTLFIPTPDEQEAVAAWVWWHPHKNSPVGRFDKHDGYVCCSLFRSESDKWLSSSLILAAEQAAIALWPADRMAVDWLGFDTYVEAAKVKSDNPGYCYLKAGYRRDGYSKDGLKLHLVKAF